MKTVDELVEQKVLPEFHGAVGFGVDLEDRYGLLKGDGKNARYVKVRTVEGAPVEALRFYIAEAIKRDALW